METFNEHFEKLNDIFSKKHNIPQQRPDLTNIHQNTEKSWKANIHRYPGEKLIKFLLICEAPPITGKYFYSDVNTYLFKQVWKAFFTNPVCPNPNDAYQCLADRGFLLIDTLPFPVKYQSRHRKKPAYYNLISVCLPWWLNKLNSNYKFDFNLKIAFGFKLNALSIIKASNGRIHLNGVPHPLSSNMIAKSGSGQPTASILSSKFGITSKSHCHKC